jgi:hypothetical protein
MRAGRGRRTRMLAPVDGPVYPRLGAVFGRHRARAIRQTGEKARDLADGYADRLLRRRRWVVAQPSICRSPLDLIELRKR